MYYLRLNQTCFKDLIKEELAKRFNFKDMEFNMYKTGMYFFKGYTKLLQISRNKSCIETVSTLSVCVLFKIS